MVDVRFEEARAREREAWRRFAFLAAEVINISGKTVKRMIKPEQLIRFQEEGEKPDREKMQKELAEIVQFQKKKAWAKIADKSVKRIAGE